MEKVTRVGIDLGKHVYQVCAMDGSGAVVFQRQVKAPRLMELMAQIEPCRVGMEASWGAHHWVGKLSELGHDVRMMSPQFCAPVREIEQERRPRRGGDLRGGVASDDA